MENINYSHYQKYFLTVCVTILSFIVIISTYLLLGQPTTDVYTNLTAIIMIMGVISIYPLFKAFIFYCPTLHCILYTLPVVVSIILTVVFLASEASLLPYYESCVDAIGNNIDLKIYDCIDYAIENPDATGAEIINAIQPEKIEDSILDKPLER